MLDRLTKAISLVALAVALAACDPFGLPSTRALENGASGMLTSAQALIVALFGGVGSVRRCRDHGRGKASS